ncbi:MAG: SUMF1/EgtB/PvdO family nonheme iron enzyme [Chloroflexota bacterium]
MGDFEQDGRLSGMQVEALGQALINGYSLNTLRRMVRIRLDIRLDEVAGGENFADVVYNLIDWAEQTGRVERLVAEAYRFNSGNQRLRRVAEEILGEAFAEQRDDASERAPSGSDASEPDSAERNQPRRNVALRSAEDEVETDKPEVSEPSEPEEHLPVENPLDDAGPSRSGNREYDNDEENAANHDDVKSLLETLKNLKNPERLRQSTFANSALVRQRMAQKPTLTVDQALTELFTDTLTLLAQEHPLLADQLRGLFWEGLTATSMVDEGRPERQGKARFRRQRDKALVLFMDLLYAQEAGTFALPAQMKERFTLPVEKKPKIEFDWVTIPEGPFWMGSQKPANLLNRLFGVEEKRERPTDPLAMDSELPQHEVNLAEFRIARVPVTNGQYKLFVDDQDYQPPTHWEGSQITIGKENHPVVNVSWHDAMAFCDWAGVQLPSEAQWEKAARGTDGQLYPWGNESPTRKLCNFGNIVGGTTSVGHYPGGASPYGCLDVAGNVWEWTSSLCKPYPYDPTDGREDSERDGDRLWRGGSFVDLIPGVRCAFRYHHVPTARYDLVGFRFVSPL